MRRAGLALRRSCRAWPLGLVLALAGQVVCAQLAAGLRIDSDYRWRGESLSDGRPSLRAQLAWDGSDGAFAGLSAGTARLGHERGGWQLTGHAGYARQGSGHRPGWEVGMLATRFSAEPEADYGEVFAGLLGSAWSVRLHASPDYYGRGTPAGYIEVDAAWALAPGWRGQVHAGALTWLGSVPAGLARTRADWRLGLSRALGDAQLQLAWDTRSGRGLYPYGLMHEAPRSAWVLSLGYAF